MKKVLALALSLGILAVVPASASADIFDEIKAGNRVEQKLVRKYPGYSSYAFCDQQERRFWCTYGGTKGDCFIDGHAWVYKHPWRVRFVNPTRECY
jgi:hypothetical protein